MFLLVQCHCCEVFILNGSLTVVFCVQMYLQIVFSSVNLWLIVAQLTFEIEFALVTNCNVLPQIAAACKELVANRAFKLKANREKFDCINFR